MKNLYLASFALVATLAVPQMALPQSEKLNTPPAGFTALFNGSDLTGWRGLKGDYSPHQQALLSVDELKAMQVTWNADRDLHWSVDTAKREIVSDGKGVFLATAKDYGNFELYVDWLMVNHNGDSGIYLRGYPQVQIWDVDNPREVNNGAPKGSGGLYNDNPDNPGKWPLVKADNPVGTWNTFRIKMIDTRVWVWFNDKLTVDGQVFDNNYFTHNTLPLLPTGPVELQTHGSEIRFRNIYIREIGADEARTELGKIGSAAAQAVPTAAAAAAPKPQNTPPGGVYSVGNGTTPPSVISKVDPEYSEEARGARLSGAVNLSFTVNTDGNAEDVKVVKGLGSGLDEKAVEAIQKWTFKPGTNNGVPVKVHALVAVTFTLKQRSEKGDLGAISFLATDAKWLESLKLSDRAHNYTEFTLSKQNETMKIADIVLKFGKADPETKRFTLSILADGERAEKKDRTVNQPLQFYAGKSMCDVVVYGIDRDQIVGYLSVPK